MVDEHTIQAHSMPEDNALRGVCRVELSSTLGTEVFCVWLPAQYPLPEGSAGPSKRLFHRCSASLLRSIAQQTRLIIIQLLSFSGLSLQVNFTVSGELPDY